MPNANDLVQLIKQTAVDAVKAEKPINACYGTVTQVSPLQILVDQKLLLGINQLVLSRNVTDFQTEVTISSSYGWKTENKNGGSGYDAFSSHNHDINMKSTITIHNGLVKGDEVILIRQQGGQKYIVWDRVGT